MYSEFSDKTWWLIIINNWIIIQVVVTWYNVVLWDATHIFLVRNISRSTYERVSGYTMNMKTLQTKPSNFIPFKVISI